MAERIRTCAYAKCGQAFTPKIKGMHQRYCRDLCRVRAWQERNPRDPEIARRYNRSYEERHRQRRNAEALARYHRRCECGNAKPSVDAPMCVDCAAMPSTAQAL